MRAATKGQIQEKAFSNCNGIPAYELQTQEMVLDSCHILDALSKNYLPMIMSTSLPTFTQPYEICS
jgi:hypothetical protein